MLKPTTDPGVTSGLSEAIIDLLPAIETFVQFPARDRAAEDLVQWKALFDCPLPEKGCGAAETLALLRDEIIPRGLRTGAPGFAGWVTTMPTVVPVAAAFCASVAASQRYWIHPGNMLEAVALEWLQQLLGLPRDWQGTFNSGGAAANLIGLAAARQWAGENCGLDTARDGLESFVKPRLYASDQVHHVVNRAAAVLGLGRRAIVRVPTDGLLRIDAGQLRDLVRRDKAASCTPVAVVASAGTVNTGAIDPLSDILDVCREEGVWLHVDGAYGGFGVLDPKLSDAYEALAHVDSLAIDPHKWMAVPLGCGATFVRDRALLGRALTLEPAEYLEVSEISDDEEITSQFDALGTAFHDFNIEQSARSRGVTVWAALKEIGAEGMRRRVQAHNAFARRLAELVEASPVLELLAPVTLSICCFRYVAKGLAEAEDGEEALNALNRELLRRLHAEARHVPSSTVIDGRFAIRACYINPRTARGDVDSLARDVARIGGRISREEAG